MPYGEWVARHQTEATPAARAAFARGPRRAEAQSGRRQQRVLPRPVRRTESALIGGDLHALDAVAGLHPLDAAVRQAHQGVAAVGAGEDADQRDLAAGEADAVGGGACLRRLRGDDRGHRRHRLRRRAAHLLGGLTHRDDLHGHGLGDDLLPHRGGLGDDGPPRRRRGHHHLAPRRGLLHRRLDRDGPRGGGHGLRADHRHRRGLRRLGGGLRRHGLGRGAGGRRLGHGGGDRGCGGGGDARLHERRGLEGGHEHGGLGGSRRRARAGRQRRALGGGRGLGRLRPSAGASGGGRRRPRAPAGPAWRCGRSPRHRARAPAWRPGGAAGR